MFKIICAVFPLLKQFGFYFMVKGMTNHFIKFYIKTALKVYLKKTIILIKQLTI